MLSTPKEKRKMSSQTLSDLLEQSESFVMAAVNGSISSLSVKKKALMKAGLINPDGAHTTTVVAMIAICSRLCGMGDEPYSSAIRRVMPSADPN